MAPEIIREKIAIRTADGAELSGRWWKGAHASERSIIFVPALAAPQEYLNFFASYLADHGWGVMTFDYRGTGSSTAVANSASATLDDWAGLDLPAVLAELKNRANPEYVVAAGHSIGGQLIGQSPVRHEIDGMLLLSSQRGIPAFYKGAGRLRIEYAYAVFPILINLLGRLPVSSLTLPGVCSGPALKQWVRWGRSGVFTDIEGRNVEGRFEDFKGPLTTVIISDDDYYAPPPSVEALAQVYTNADIRRITIRPQDYGMESIGHFGFFHRRAPRKLWAQAADWLRDMETQSLEIRSQNKLK